MKRNNLILWIVVIAGIFIISCEDFIEPNLQKRSINVLSPPDGLKSSTTTITFWWEEVKGAIGYDLQIVSTSFANIQQLVVDTNVTGLKFSYTLTPGQYQWRVRAYNGSSNTNYITRNLTIDSTYDLINTSPVLTSPIDNFATTTSLVTFQWQAITNASEYRIQLKDTSSNVLKDTTVINNSVLMKIQNEGFYKWYVRAQNNISNSNYSSRTIIIDRTVPGKPTLTSPADKTQTTNPRITFQWTRPQNLGSPIKDSLYIYSDSLVTLDESIYLQGTSYADSLGVGTYFWRVISIDAAGNKSPYSNANKLIISQ